MKSLVSRAGSVLLLLGLGCEKEGSPPSCSPGETQCLASSSTRYRQCTGGSWSEPLDCGAGQACVNGGCGGVCRPGQRRCSTEAAMQTCDSAGSWGPSVPCASGCASDSCRNECSAGQTRCASETDLMTCGSAGQYGAPSACARACDATQNRCGGDCSPGDRECVGQTPRLCVGGLWQAQTPCRAQCVSGSCTGECDLGARRCSPSAPQVPQQCSAQGSWVDQAACDAGCSAGQCAAACSPQQTVSCATLEGSLGVCAARTLTCSADGRWPRQLCQPTSAEICDASGRDENCDGHVDEQPTCPLGFASIWAGPNYACGTTTAGGVVCWGSGGNLGEASSSENRATPVSVPEVSSVLSVAAGANGACAVLVGGSALCWGGNGDSDGTPARVLELSSNIRSLVPGETSTCALLKTGTVRCIEIGSGPLVGFEGIQNESGSELSGVESIDTQGGFAFCALLTDGSASCWGGGFPDDPLDDPPRRARAVPEVQGARQVVAGASHACALVGNAVFCWGSNSSGQLGADPQQTVSSPLPLAIDLSGASIQAIDAGEAYTCALLSNGRVRCWGGLGPDTTPVPVEIAGITQGVSISAGADAACVVRADHTAMCFGDNRFGQLGNGQFSPITVESAEFLPAVRVLGP